MGFHPELEREPPSPIVALIHNGCGRCTRWGHADSEVMQHCEECCKKICNWLVDRQYHLRIEPRPRHQMVAADIGWYTETQEASRRSDRLAKDNPLDILVRALIARADSIKRPNREYFDLDIGGDEDSFCKLVAENVAPEGMLDALYHKNPMAVMDYLNEMGILGYSASKEDAEVGVMDLRRDVTQGRYKPTQRLVDFFRKFHNLEI